MNMKNSMNQQPFPMDFGKHKGKTVRDILLNEPGYYNWMMDGDFPQQTKNVLSKIRQSLKNG